MNKNLLDLAILEDVAGLPPLLQTTHIVKNLPFETKHNFSQEQCTALYAAYKLESLNVDKLESLRMTAELVPFQKTGIEIQGTLRARVHQTCVATLEPVVKVLKEGFSHCYLPQHKLKSWFEDHPDLEEKLAEENPPELLPEHFDLTRIAAETLILSIDPFVRKHTEKDVNVSAAPPGAKIVTSDTVKPFAALAALKEKMEKDGGT